MRPRRSAWGLHRCASSSHGHRGRSRSRRFTRSRSRSLRCGRRRGASPGSCRWPRSRSRSSSRGASFHGSSSSARCATARGPNKKNFGWWCKSRWAVSLMPLGGLPRLGGCKLNLAPGAGLAAVLLEGPSGFAPPLRLLLLGPSRGCSSTGCGRFKWFDRIFSWWSQIFSWRAFGCWGRIFDRWGRIFCCWGRIPVHQGSVHNMQEWIWIFRSSFFRGFLFSPFFLP